MNQLIYRLISKRKKISPHIEKFEFDIGIFIVSIWVVEKNNQYFLIDSGLAKLLPRMAEYVVRNFYDKERVAGVFLTHGHSDHIGGIPTLKTLLPNLPIVIDSREIPFVSGEKPYPGREKLEPFTFKKQDFIELGTPESNALLEKAGLTAIHSPGHSPGHTCYYHSEDNLLIGGDLLTTDRAGVLSAPMKEYTADMLKALQTAHSLLKEYSQAILSVAHGGEVKNALQEMEKSEWFQNS